MNATERTSESVTEGHPDKLCDQIADTILDAYLRKDSQAHVAIECMISQNLLVIAGEIRSSASINLEALARAVLRSVGYNSREKGFDCDRSLIITNVNQQSKDISQGVDCALEFKQRTTADGDLKIGAGDQGTVYGYACNEAEDYLPLTLYLAHRLTRRLAEVRKQGVFPFLRPDGKAQVTVRYDENDRPVSVKTVVLSAQHDEAVSREELTEKLTRDVIQAVVPAELLRNSELLINPTGRFVIGGPQGDTGLTGRKIIIDTYGGVIPHGGGAFSGKDPSKVDRSGAYMARYAAKNVVAAGLADRCQIAVSYAIGVAEPVSVSVETFGTERIPLQVLQAIVHKTFQFAPGSIIETLHLRRPIYQSTACYGHFKSGFGYPWEETDQVGLLERLKRAVVQAMQR
ncbi:methionine adenosyltransferase [Sporolactobacillus shoreicorticis]|uniref:S-adenosylmethionine synthase n=1 Tax=Sporolactobacillus shoreicorticis TaxID=1923877 RepID=A0ABW5S3K6_9BACL|nr:methionine adenosyltransferase [Sporolactobacillus shoreicorticis]MCO7124446.1 methionine adenosyltransferase [Sporolactobacillus shoreicorticis]